MNTKSIRVRGVCLNMLILAAIGHADLDANHPTSIGHVSGLGRLGRDLGRRATEAILGRATHISKVG